MNLQTLPDASAAPVRSCGSCTMCCKVFDTPLLDAKPAGSWCKHCKPGRGCAIWDDRPQFCRDFICNWLTNPSLGEEWRPDRCKFVMTYRPTHGSFVITVDAGSPSAWRKEPYHTVIRQLAGWLANERHILQVMVNREVIVVTPTREFPMGFIRGDLALRWVDRQGPGGLERELVEVSVKQPDAA